MEPFIFLSFIAFIFIVWKHSGNTVKIERKPKRPFPETWRKILLQKVDFYKRLNEKERTHFEYRIHVFILNIKIIGLKTQVNAEDRLLVASSAIIPIFRFPQWRYEYLHEVLLYPTEFNIIGSRYKAIGLVGYGHMEGRMILSKEALHAGFKDNNDRKNVGIHEFSHLIDKQDGIIDGIPSALLEKENIEPWLALIREKTEEIINNNSTIRNYASTNSAEFMAVVTEYFFEKPQLLAQNHPKLFKALSELFNHKSSIIMVKKVKKESLTQKSDPCPCGSGVKYKICCYIISKRGSS